MATQPRSSHPLLSKADGVAAGMTDALLAVAGGLLVLFVTGGGRFSVDAMLANK